MVELLFIGPDSTTSRVTTQAWEELAASLPENFKAIDGKSAAAVEKLPDHTVLPLWDRNCFNTPWRRVFVVLDTKGVQGPCVHVFDEAGLALDEPDEGVDRGVQLLHGDEGTFIDDFTNGYYAPAHEPEFDEQNLDGDGDKGKDGGENAELRAGLAIGARFCMCFGDPPAWYGCMVDEFVQPTDSYLCALDDGDLRLIPFHVFVTSQAASVLRFPTADEMADGLVNNVGGYPTAAVVVRHKEGRSPDARPVGVLVGETTYKLGELPLYTSYHVADDSFFRSPEADTQGKRSTRSSTDEGNQEASLEVLKDRRGFHTFRRGDKVSFTELEEGETCVAIVFAVSWKNPEKGGPSPKYVVLQEEASGVFFLGMYTQWKRIHRGVAADTDDDGTAQALTAEAEAKMIAQFDSAGKLAHLSSPTKMHANAVHISRFGPPYLEQSRKDDKKEQQAELRREKRRRGKAGNAPAAAGPAGRGKNKREPRNRNRAGAPEAALEPQPLPPIDDGKAAAAAHELKVAQDKIARLQRSLLTTQQRLAAEKKGGQTDESRGADTPSSVPQPPAMAPPSRLPPGWEQATDAAGNVYYFNHSLNTSQWHPPQPQLPPPPGPPPPSQQEPRRSPRLSPPASVPRVRCDRDVSPPQRGASNMIERMIAQHKAQMAYATTEAVRMYHAGEIASLQFRLLE